MNHYPPHHAGKFNRRRAKVKEMIPPDCFNVMDEHDWIIGGKKPNEYDHQPSHLIINYGFAPVPKKARYF